MSKSNNLNNLLKKYIQLKLNNNSMSSIIKYVNRIDKTDKLHDMAVLKISRQYVKLNQFDNAFNFSSNLSTHYRDIFHDSLYAEVSHIQAKNKNFKSAIRSANAILNKSKMNIIYYRIFNEALKPDLNLPLALEISELMSPSSVKDTLNFKISLFYFNTNNFIQSEKYADKIFTKLSLKDQIYSYLISKIVQKSKENKKKKTDLSLWKSHNTISLRYKNDAIRISKKIDSVVIKNRSDRLINTIG